MKRSPKNQFKVKKTSFIKATTTPLVKDTFDTLFTNQLDGPSENKVCLTDYFFIYTLHFTNYIPILQKKNF